MKSRAPEFAADSGAHPAPPAATTAFGALALPVELFLALRYLKLWRALGSCLLLSVTAIALVLLGADLVFAFKKWADSTAGEIALGAGRLLVEAAVLTGAVVGLIKVGKGYSRGIIMGIAIYGVTIGVAVLIIVLSVMSGFDRQMREKILGMDSHLIITNLSTRVVQTPSEALAVVKGEPHVRGAAPFVLGHVLIEANERLSPALMKGIDPELERTVSELPSWIAAGTLDVSGDGAVIGAELARQLGVSLHDKITVYAPKDFEHYKKKEEAYLPTELEITGIFRVDMYEFDSKYVFVSLNTARELYLLEGGAHAIGVRLDDPWHADVVRQGVQDKLPQGLAALTWAQMNRPIFAALRTEKAVMFFILLIITVVAAFGIASTLFTVSIQKTREIGLLQALGATPQQITAVFVLLSVFVGLVGTLLGVGHGLLALHYRNGVLRWLTALTDWELFPAAIYNFSQIPAEVNAGDTLTIAVSALIICALAGVAPAIRSARLNPVEALRYE
jgi:lipoprotein-releasing system permease protein